MSEVSLTPETISHFRKQYLSAFGAATRDDALYQAVSEGRRYAGMEHWLPLFYEKLETVFDYLEAFASSPTMPSAKPRPSAPSSFSTTTMRARTPATPGKGQMAQGTPYKPVTPEPALSRRRELQRSAGCAQCRCGFRPSTSMKAKRGSVITVDARQGERWAQMRPRRRRDAERVNVFDQVVKYIADKRASGAQGARSRPGRKARSTACCRCWTSTAWNASSRSRRLRTSNALEAGRGGFGRAQPRIRLRDRQPRCHRRAGHSRRPHGAPHEAPQARLPTSLRKSPGSTKARSSSTPNTASAVSSACRRSRRPARRTPVSSCVYADDAKLFLPVENIDLLSRYGARGHRRACSTSSAAVAWQARKAKLKKRLLDMAGGAHPHRRRAADPARAGADDAGRPLRRIRRPLPL